MLRHAARRRWRLRAGRLNGLGAEQGRLAPLGARTTTVSVGCCITMGSPRRAPVFSTTQGGLIFGIGGSCCDPSGCGPRGSVRRMSERYVLRHVGREIAYVLEDRALLLTFQGSERRIELDAIRSVRVARIGTLHACALTLDGGSETTIATDEPGSRAAFTSLVQALYAALASRNVPFVGGSMLVVSIIAVSCVAVAVLGACLYLGVIDAPGLETRGAIVALVCVLVGPFMAYRARPKPVMSEAELTALLPR